MDDLGLTDWQGINQEAGVMGGLALDKGLDAGWSCCGGQRHKDQTGGVALDKGLDSGGGVEGQRHR